MTTGLHPASPRFPRLAAAARTAREVMAKGKRKRNAALLGTALLGGLVLSKVAARSPAEKLRAREIEVAQQILENPRFPVPRRVYLTGDAKLDSPGNYTGWVRNLASRLYGRNYETGRNAFVFAECNKVLERRWGKGANGQYVRTGFTQAEIVDRIASGVIKPGTAIGTYYADSPHNLEGAPYSHVVMYLGPQLVMEPVMENGKGVQRMRVVHWFGHNFVKGPATAPLESFFASGSRLQFLDILRPK